MVGSLARGRGEHLAQGLVGAWCSLTGGACKMEGAGRSRHWAQVRERYRDSGIRVTRPKGLSH